MTINQNLSLAEYFRVILTYWLHHRLGRRVLVIVLFLPPLSSVLGMLTTASGFSFVQLLAGIISGIILLSIIVLIVFLLCLFIYLARPHLFRNVSYDFTHWGVTRNGKGTEFSKPWREFTGYRETNAFFLLYVGTTDFHFIQKRMLTGPEETDLFRDLLKEKIVITQKR